MENLLALQKKSPFIFVVSDSKYKALAKAKEALAFYKTATKA